MTPVSKLGECFARLGRPLLVASHPRSGTHLTIDLLRKQFAEFESWKRYGEGNGRLYFTLEELIARPEMNPAKPLAVLKRAERPLVKTHLLPGFGPLQNRSQEWVTWIRSEADMIYVLRDGRQVMCSLHLYMQSFDPATRCSSKEFIRQSKNGQTRIEEWANHVRRWSGVPEIFILKYEDILSSTGKTIANLERFLALEACYSQPLLPKATKGVWHGRFNRLWGRRPESSAILGFYGGQKVRRWREAFDEDDLQLFREQAGDVLEKFGYNS